MSKKFIEIKNAILTRSPDFLHYPDVSQEEFNYILHGLRHRTNYLEEHSFRISWFSFDKILKVVMPSKIHESPSEWMYEMLHTATSRCILPEIFGRTMRISRSPEYDNFTGKYKQSVKEADMTFVPLVGPDWMAKAEYPSVVLESGWYESAKALERDARLWQLGSEGAVRVVLQVKFSRPDQENDPIRVRLSINRTAPPGDLAHVKHYEIFPAPNDQEANTYIKLKEFYAGDCPPGIEPESCVHLNLERLRAIARIEILDRGNLPA